jgi:uncharacterized protein (TIGR02646 family)
MRHKSFSEPNDPDAYPWYAEWGNIARDETQRARDAYEKKECYEFKSRIWGAVKEYLFEYFDGKCAYCESKVLHVASGDVEHYAPKSKVTDDPDHPGYYWLAYDLRNLLPSCEKCNRAGGKMNHFPVVKFLTAHASEELFGQEAPMLLNPYFDNDLDKHFAFTPPDLEREQFFGTVVGLTERGKKTIEICNLNREKLIEARRERQRAYLDEILRYTVRIQLNNALTEVRAGTKEYSAALLVVATEYGRYIQRLIFGRTDESEGKDE